MIHRIFRSGRGFQLIWIILVSVLLWMAAIIRPPSMPAAVSTDLLYNLILGVFSGTPRLAVIVAWLLLMAQAAFLNSILTSNNLIPRDTYIGSFFYILLMSFSPLWLTLNPILLINALLLLSLKLILKASDKESAYKEFFSAGMLLGIASLFWFRAIYLLPLFWVCLIVFRIYSWREWLILHVGLLIVLLYVLVGYLLADRMQEVAHAWIEALLHPVFTMVSLGAFWTNYVFWAVCGLVFLVSVAGNISAMGEKLINIRKVITIMIWWIMFSSIVAFLHGENLLLSLPLILLPGSMLCGIYYYNVKRIFFSELLFLMLTASLILLRVV